MPFFEISAASGKGVRELISYAASMLDNLGPVAVYEPEIYDEIEETGEDFTVSRDNDAYVVEGPYVEKLLRGVNFDDDESLQYFQRALRRKGIIDALREKGCGEGDPVRMYELEFDFVE